MRAGFSYLLSVLYSLLMTDYTLRCLALVNISSLKQIIDKRAYLVLTLVTIFKKVTLFPLCTAPSILVYLPGATAEPR